MRQDHPLGGSSGNFTKESLCFDSDWSDVYVVRNDDVRDVYEGLCVGSDCSDVYAELVLWL